MSSKSKKPEDHPNIDELMMLGWNPPTEQIKTLTMIEQLGNQLVLDAQRAARLLDGIRDNDLADRELPCGKTAGEVSEEMFLHFTDQLYKTFLEYRKRQAKAYADWKMMGDAGGRRIEVVGERALNMPSVVTAEASKLIAAAQQKLKAAQQK